VIGWKVLGELMPGEAIGLAKGVHGFGEGGVERGEVDGFEDWGFVEAHGYSSILLVRNII
jgi:hypothetical protein